MTFSLRSPWVIGAILVYICLWIITLIWRLQEPVAMTFSSDASQYSGAAIHLLQQGMYSLDGIHPYTEREPGQSFFLAMIYAVFGIENRVALFVVMGILYVASSYVFARMLARMHQPCTGLIAFWILLLFPAGFHVVFSADREGLSLCLFMLFVAALWRLHESRGIWIAVLSGLLFGALILTYMSFLFLPFILLPVAWFAWRIPWSSIAACFVITMLIVAAWGIRTSLVVGHPALAGGDRLATVWYVRGEQAQHVHGTEPFLCLWSEYISRNWTGRSPDCSFNALKHIFDKQDAATQQQWAALGKQKILQYFPYYLWFSVFEILELHLPFVDSWGLPYNALAAMGSVLLYVGVLATLPDWRRRTQALFLAVIVYNMLFFVLTDATPRYFMPVFFAYAALAAVGYHRLLSRFHLCPP